MDKTILQVPISKTLRKDALKAARYNGFSSTQEAIRVFLTKFARHEIGVDLFTDKTKDASSPKKVLLKKSK